jgi:hypothetical protein
MEFVTAVYSEVLLVLPDRFVKTAIRDCGLVVCSVCITSNHQLNLKPIVILRKINSFVFFSDHESAEHVKTKSPIPTHQDSCAATPGQAMCFPIQPDLLCQYESACKRFHKRVAPLEGGQ